MEYKALGELVECKATGQGLATAVFSRLNVVDLDGDVTLPGAVPEGAVVPVSPWNHGIWQRGTDALPVGKATLSSSGDVALAECAFFMESQAGRDTWSTIKALGSVQWSYGYDVLDHAFGDFKGRRVRFLKSLAIYEVSPVLRGAGIGTGTANLRAMGEAELRKYLMRMVEPARQRLGISTGEDQLARELLATEVGRYVARVRS